MFVWLAQSCYSFLQAASHPHELVESINESGYAGLCLTDFDGVYGLVKGWNALKEHPQQRFACGAQVPLALALPSLPEALQQEPLLPPFLQDRISYVAQTATAYREICTLLTHIHRNGKTATPITLDDETPWPTTAPAIIPMRGSIQLFSPREQKTHRVWLARLEQLCSRHSGELFLAITPPTSALERNAFENQMAAHAALGIPLLATEDLFFHTPDRKALLDLLTAIRHNQTIAEIPWARFPNAERHLHHARVLERFCNRTPELRSALANNERLEASLDFRLDELHYRYPSEFIPDGFTAATYLRHLTEAALRERYPDGSPDRLHSLMEKELVLVEELRFADYFLTVWDIVRFARSQQILCQGRGSAANSAICFLLGITAVDPMVSDVLFERFISRERGEPPDIDVDFEHERREEVIQYIYTRYGRARAAMVANVITFKTRGATRAVTKALGSAALENANSERVATMVQELRGFPRHLGIHSGGFVVSQEPLTHLSGIEPATMEGRSIIQWNKDDLESLGFFKIDVLALGMLTALRKTFAILLNSRKRIPGTLLPIRLDTIPPDCSLTYQMIREARTTGVFQIESRAQMSILPRIKPKDFYDLVVSIGIVRPGPIVSGMVHSYVRRRLGLEPVTIPDNRLVPILERTLGVPVFQEQVMRVAMAVADFTPGEADELRRAMGAWKISGDMQRFEEKLRAGMKKNGIPDEFADVIYRQINGFSQYGFPESHATSFAHLAYASSWLKAHHPAEFLCGLLNAQPLGFYSIHSLLQEARHAGVQIFAPCLFASQWDSFITLKGAVQLGFRLLSNIQKEHVEEFIERRKSSGIVKRLFHGTANESASASETLFELLGCLHSHEQIGLAMAGCFRRLERDRPTLLWKILANPSRLLPDVEPSNLPPQKAELEAWDNLQDDYQHLNTTLAQHPLALIKQLAWPFPVKQESITTARTLATFSHGRTATVAGLQMIRQRPPTAKGMVFITLEDETGTINLVLRPDVYLKYQTTVSGSDLLCVTGKTQGRGAAATLLVTSVLAPERSATHKAPATKPERPQEETLF
jgi:error-prone DNA polymerase